jgi:hypothetical protein
MGAIVILFITFAAIGVLATLLAAVHDLVEAAVVATRSSRPHATAGQARPARPARSYQLSQFDGAGTPFMRPKMYSTAALKPAGRVSRCRAPGTLT